MDPIEPGAVAAPRCLQHLGFGVLRGRRSQSALGRPVLTQNTRDMGIEERVADLASGVLDDAAWTAIDSGVWERNCTLDHGVHLLERPAERVGTCELAFGRSLRRAEPQHLLQHLNLGSPRHRWRFLARLSSRCMRTHNKAFTRKIGGATLGYR